MARVGPQRHRKQNKTKQNSIITNYLKIFLSYTELEMMPRRARNVKQMSRPLYKNNVEIFRAKKFGIRYFLK
jgi:hypothetical protein